MRANLKRLALLLPWLLLGCGNTDSERDIVLARAGDMKLTRAGFEALAGAPPDSLPKNERWSIINGWIENAVVLQEGRRQGLDKDERLKASVEEMRANLFLTELLRRETFAEPSDEEIAGYYEERHSEFVSSAESFLLRLYNAPACSLLSAYQARWLSGDTTLTAADGVTLDRHELLTENQLTDALQQVLAGLEPGDWTQPQAGGDGCWTLQLEATYPPGSQLPLEAVRPEIVVQLTIDTSHRQREAFMSELRSRFPVTILLEDSL